jgi:DNA-binding Lrp family transcriptional regulator
MKSLKPQDVVVLLKLVKSAGRPAYAKLAAELCMSSSEVHASVKRARAARLIHGPELNNRPNIGALEEFLVHGVKYAFPPERGSIVRGLPTGSAAEPLNHLVSQEEPVPVWPCAEGSVRGYAFLPLCKSAPQAALKDAELYQMLALVDAIRDGGARERGLAQRELVSRLRAS